MKEREKEQFKLSKSENTSMAVLKCLVKNSKLTKYSD